MIVNIHAASWTSDGSYGYGLAYMLLGFPVPKRFNLRVCQISIL